jgi:hypothetical protein
MIAFPPEFFGMATGLWTVYWPVVFIWLFALVGMVMLAGVGLMIFFVIRPMLGK